MPGFWIDSYSVNHLARRSASTAATRERIIALHGKSNTPHPIRNAALVFSPGQPTELATVVGEPYNYITGRYPLADFEDAYRMLQTERPLAFTWVFVAGTQQVNQLLLTTSTEPIGEGPTDPSPLMRTLAEGAAAGTR